MNRIHPSANERKEIKILKRKLLCFILFCITSSISLLIFLYKIIEH